MHVIAHKGKLYAFETKKNETELDSFIARCWFIVKNMDKYEDYVYLEGLSHIWANCKFLQVRYDDQVMAELSQCVDP